MPGPGGFEEGAQRAAEEERKLQAATDSREQGSSGGGEEKEEAMQAGARRYPEPPFPEQHLKQAGAARPTSTPRRCTTRPSTRARAS